MFSKYIEKWKSKKKIDQAGDILFILFLIALAIPQSRMVLLVSMRRVFAFQPGIIAEDKREQVEESGFFWPMETLEGQRVNLEDYEGQVLFINIWATWCPPCVAEMPSIEKLYKEFEENEGIEFIIVSNEKRETVRSFMEDEGYSFPVMLSRGSPPGDFSVKSIPTTFLVSPEGEIVLKEVGSRKWHGEDTFEIINQLLSQ